MMKNPQPQTIHYIQFSSSWVTEARHYLQLTAPVLKEKQYLDSATKSRGNSKNKVQFLVTTESLLLHAWPGQA